MLATIKIYDNLSQRAKLARQLAVCKRILSTAENERFPLNTRSTGIYPHAQHVIWMSSRDSKLAYTFDLARVFPEFVLNLYWSINFIKPLVFSHENRVSCGPSFVVHLFGLNERMSLSDATRLYSKDQPIIGRTSAEPINDHFLTQSPRD